MSKAMTYVPLNRLFSRWYGEDFDRGDFALFSRNFHGEQGWSELLKFQRVVILAEAGSGKTEELQQQARQLIEEGKPAFYATVQNIGHDGLAVALGREARARFEVWRASNETGWFFIDSVDEAKLDNVRLETALNRLDDALGDALPRARIILSGRYADWEFRADLAKLTTALPIAVAAGDPPTKSPNELLSEILRNDGARRSKTEEVEKPLVVLMAPLDDERIRKYAANKGVNNLDEFVQALDDANLWSLAKRPLDLEWLVAYWRDKGQFGTFADMLGFSLKARLQERNPDRRRRDELDAERSMAALERVGAAMVFGRIEKIEIPDSVAELAPTSAALRLTEILPDWSEDHQALLLARAVFDPESLGRVRLHNDNEGVVRGYLAAQWLLHRINANASRHRIRNLLFAEAEGEPIVLPSVAETTAWLAIWDPDTAREVIARDPRLLLAAGDPGSLTLANRAAALKAYAARLAAEDTRHDLLDRDTLRRLATPEIIPALREVWAAHADSEEVRRLVLMIIELGRLAPCLDIASSSLASHTDRTTLVSAGRALLALGTEDNLRDLADRVAAEFQTLPDILVWEALTALYPRFLSVSQLLAILKSLGAAEEPYGDFSWRAPEVVRQATSTTDLEELVGGLLSLLAPAAPEFGDEAAPDERAHFPALRLACVRLLNGVPQDHLPPVAAAAALRIWANRYFQARSDDDEGLDAAIHATPQRRRAGFWFAYETLSDHPRLHGQILSNLMQLEIAGWRPGLMTTDSVWLLEDAAAADTLHKAQLCIDAVMQLWRDAGRPADLLAQIVAVADRRVETRAQVDAWTTPRVLSPEELNLNRQMEQSRRKREAQDAKRDQSWVEFLDHLKANPSTLRDPLPDLKPGYIDARLPHLWQLWRAASAHKRPDYALDDLAPLAPVLGPALTSEVRQALIRYWKENDPQLDSQKTDGALNSTRNSDIVGLSGVSLEARSNPDWADHLSPELARRAASFAMLELNGFPGWFLAFARKQPAAVREVILGEIRAQLARPLTQPMHGVVEKVSSADPELARLVSNDLAEQVVAQENWDEHHLSRMMDVIHRGMAGVVDPDTLAGVAIDRVRASTDEGVIALYLAMALRLRPMEALAALSERLDALDPGGQTSLALHLLPHLFGDSVFRTTIKPSTLPFDVLERLVVIAFSTIRPEDDAEHDGPYTPDLRDNAEHARSELFNQLLKTPGRPTIEALKRLASRSDFPVKPQRLREMIRDRAAENAEHSQWPASEARDLEVEFDRAPATPRDIQHVAMERLHDLQHRLHHSDFAQGRTLKALPNEPAVQIWIADQLDLRKGRAYSVERESEVVDGKAPDIRMRAKVSHASVPVEIKIVDDRPLADLEGALTTQLSARYLRDRDAKHGVLLLVHQNARPRGWDDGSGKFLTFAEVVSHLRTKAHQMEGEGLIARAPLLRSLMFLTSPRCGIRSERRTIQPFDRGDAVKASR